MDVSDDITAFIFVVEVSRVW